MAYSNDGAYLAVIDERKVTTAYTVADGYSVSIYLSYIFFLWISQYPVTLAVYKKRQWLIYTNYFSFFFFFSTRSKMSFTDTMPNQCAWPGHPIMSTLRLVGWTWWCISGQLVTQTRGLSSQVGLTSAQVQSRMPGSHADIRRCAQRLFCLSCMNPLCNKIINMQKQRHQDILSWAELCI